MARDSGPTGSAWRLLWLVVLPGLLLVSDLPRPAGAGAVGERALAAESPRLVASASGRATPADADVRGVPWVGDAGVTETVAQIMAREQATARAEPLEAAGATELKPPLGLPWRKLGDDPAAPAVPQWPPAPEGAGAEVAPEPNNPQAVGTSFLGAQSSESGFVPPDSMGAVGPTQVLVAVNGRIKVFDKTGTLGGLNTTTDNFFASVRTAGTLTSDPHVRYDRLSGRWFVTMIDVASVNRILIAVSSGSTITNASSFTFFGFQHDLVGPTPNADTGMFADYDTLGIDKFALYIGVNVFTSPTGVFSNTTGFVVNKANLLSGMLTVTAFRSLIDVGGGVGIYTPQGVHNDDPQATEGYFIGVDAIHFSKLVIRRISNPGGVPSISGQLTLTVPTTVVPIPQVQPSPGPTLDAIDDRLFAASIHTNKLTGARTLWTAHNIEVNTSGVGQAGGGRNGSRWYEIGSLTTTPTLIQSGTLFDAAATTPFGFWMPSVAMSGQGHMAIASSLASAAINGFASVSVAGRLRTDALGATEAPTLAQGSSFLYDLGPGTPRRWGDFSQVGVDPKDDQTLWTFQEYANATNSWGVRAIKLVAPAPATPSMATPSMVAAGQFSVDVIIDGMSVAGSEFFDPGPDTGGPGFANHVKASVAGGVVVNLVTFVSPTQVKLNISTLGATAGAQDVTITNPDGQNQTGTGLLMVTGSSPSHAFFTLTPCRVADTRNPPGPSGGPALGANTARSFPAAGLCGIPLDASAVAINVTVVDETDLGDLRLFPTGAPAPLASVVNFAPAHVRANNAIILLGNSGQISVQCDMPPGSMGTTDFLFDVYGFFR
jgi:hypothetical protein